MIPDRVAIVPAPLSLLGITLPLLVGTLMMAGASQVEIPLEPVPLTLQSFAALVIGGLLGWMRGGLAILLWLVLGGMGLSLFAGGAGGMDHLTGATAGYLLAFPIAAALSGWLVPVFSASFLRLLGVMIVGHTLCLMAGGAWLAATIGPRQALEAGVLPFLPGALLKSGLAALTLLLLFRVVRLHPGWKATVYPSSSRSRTTGRNP